MLAWQLGLQQPQPVVPDKKVDVFPLLCLQDLNLQPLLLEQLDSSYDVVLCVNGIQYLTQPETVIAEVRTRYTLLNPMLETSACALLLCAYCCTKCVLSAVNAWAGATATD